MNTNLTSQQQKQVEARFGQVWKHLGTLLGDPADVAEVGGAFGRIRDELASACTTLGVQLPQGITAPAGRAGAGNGTRQPQPAGAN